ncbi:energy transducer TonB [Flavobacterium sp. WC2509]|uniref:energy transducer TonB n=1 Tax=Flavobacterium sp. WC2509 TaxID=3461406 RepID=UPI0040449549
MKSILFSILFLFVPKLAISQISENSKIVLSNNDKLIYLDSIHLETKPKDYKFLRVIKDYKLDKQIYTVLDYYKSGALQMQKTSKSKEGYTTDGDITYYYENGNKKSIANFVNNIQSGDDFEWYENGTKKQYRTYIAKNVYDKPTHKINQYWDSNGVQKVIDGNGDYEEVNEKYFASGKVKNGFKDGLWEGYDKNIGYTFSETYENQKLVSGVSIDKERVTHTYTVIEKHPEPRNGMADFYKHIGKTFETPKVQGLAGRIYVKFFVDKDGGITEPKVIRDIGYGTGDEAIKCISSYGSWTPGELRGIKARVMYTIPITVIAR